MWARQNGVSRRDGSEEAGPSCLFFDSCGSLHSLLFLQNEFRIRVGIGVGVGVGVGVGELDTF
jgi:hypothetical protein